MVFWRGFLLGSTTATRKVGDPFPSTAVSCDSGRTLDEEEAFEFELEQFELEESAPQSSKVRGVARDRTPPASCSKVNIESGCCEDEAVAAEVNRGWRLKLLRDDNDTAATDDDEMRTAGAEHGAQRRAEAAEAPLVTKVLRARLCGSNDCSSPFLLICCCS